MHIPHTMDQNLTAASVTPDLCAWKSHLREEGEMSFFWIKFSIKNEKVISHESQWSAIPLVYFSIPPLLKLRKIIFIQTGCHSLSFYKKWLLYICDNTKKPPGTQLHFCPQMPFSCITAGHSQKGLLTKPRMSVETFPGGTAPDHHHSGTGTHSSKSNVLKDGAFISSKSLLLLCCLLPKGKVRSLYPLDRH